MTVVDVTIVAWKDVDEFDDGVDPGIGCELLPTLAPTENYKYFTIKKKRNKRNSLNAPVHMIKSGYEPYGGGGFGWLLCGPSVLFLPIPEIDHNYVYQDVGSTKKVPDSRSENQ